MVNGQLMATSEVAQYKYGKSPAQQKHAVQMVLVGFIFSEIPKWTEKVCVIPFMANVFQGSPLSKDFMTLWHYSYHKPYIAWQLVQGPNNFWLVQIK